MPFTSKTSKIKATDKAKADKIYSKLLRYALYGTMVIILIIIVVISTQSESHDTRSRASSDPYDSPMKLISENQAFGVHCYTSKDIHTRTWNGKLDANNSFTIDLPFCKEESIENLGFAVSTTRSTSYSLSAVSPSGLIMYPTDTSSQTETLCVLPTQREIEKGTWQIILTAWESEIDTSDISVVVAPRNSLELGECAQ